MRKRILSLGAALFLAFPLYVHAEGLEDGAPLVAALEDCVRKAVPPQKEGPLYRQGRIPDSCTQEANVLYVFMKKHDFAKQVEKALERTDLLGTYPYNLNFDPHAIEFSRIATLYTEAMFCRNNNNSFPTALIAGPFYDEIRSKTKDEEEASVVLIAVPHVLSASIFKKFMDGDKTEYEHWCDKIQAAFQKVPGLEQYFFKK